MEAIVLAGGLGARLYLVVADTQGHGSHWGKAFFECFSRFCPCRESLRI